MTDNSIAAELLQQINFMKLRPTPNYLLASDALTVQEFEQTEYGSEYSLDVSNIEREVHRMIVMFLTFFVNLVPIVTVLQPG